LIREIVGPGGEAELEKKFDFFSPPPLPKFEQALQEIRDRRYNPAKERGWEV